MLADHHVKVITFPSHTSHIFQSLYLSLFGNFKKKMNYKLPLDGDETTACFINGIFHMMKQTLVADNVQSAFMQPGLRYDIDTNPYVLLFDEHVLSEVPVSPHFGNEITLWRRCHKEDEMRHLVGLTRQCVPTGIAESKFPSARSRVMIHFYFTSQVAVSRTGGQFPR